jgi:hypothetical protein
MTGGPLDIKMRPGNSSMAVFRSHFIGGIASPGQAVAITGAAIQLSLIMLDIRVAIAPDIAGG